MNEIFLFYSLLSLCNILVDKFSSDLHSRHRENLIIRQIHNSIVLSEKKVEPV